MVLNWQADFRTWSADRVERPYADDYELMVLEFSATRGHRLIIWGIYTGRWFADQVATGESAERGAKGVEIGVNDTHNRSACAAHARRDRSGEKQRNDCRDKS